MENTPYSVEHILNVSGDDKEFVIEILEMFVVQAKEEVQRIIELSEQKQWQEIKLAAHKLRSSAGSVGAFKIASKCSELESYIATADDIEKRVHLYVQNFKDTCSTEMSEIETELASLLNGDDKPSIDR